MKIVERTLDGIIVFEPVIFKDSRGYFFESFSEKKFEEQTGIAAKFVQDNQSLSGKNVVRGLHFQVPPFAQGKLVRVIKGSALDVAVDIRKNSPTYGHYFSCELTEKNNLMMWIPEGFAHGFSALEDETIFVYKCTQYYNKESEQALLWNDSRIGIDWKTNTPVISDKDNEAQSLNNFKSPFTYGG